MGISTRLPVLLALLVPLPLAAQSPGAGAAGEPRTVCLRGQPRPACSTSLVTELNLNLGYYTGGPTDRYLTRFHLGWMANLDAENALGGALVLGPRGQRHRGIEGRYRRWLRPHLSLDVAPGWVGNGAGDDRFVLGLSVVVHDLVGASLHGETVPDAGGFGGGLRLASWMGLVVGGLLRLLTPDDVVSY